MKSTNYRLELNLYGRWFIVNAHDPQLAWSGSCWTEHENGVATGKTRVCNFALEEEAREYAVGVWGKATSVGPIDESGGVWQIDPETSHGRSNP